MLRRTKFVLSSISALFGILIQLAVSSDTRVFNLIELPTPASNQPAIGIFMCSLNCVLVIAQNTRYAAPRTVDGKPNLSGVSQVLNTANAQHQQFVS
jgi:hypothetical protein